MSRREETCRWQVSGGTIRGLEKDQNTKEKTCPIEQVLCWRYLSSRPVTRQVLSAQMSLTSVFRMGTGGPSSQSTPTIFHSQVSPETSFIILRFSRLSSVFFLGDPSGIRTHVNGVRGRCLNHLTMGPWVHLHGLKPETH